MADETSTSLLIIYDGWAGYQQALMSAVMGLTPDNLAWRGGDHLRSAGELIGHIATGRIAWIHDILGVESAEVDEWVEEACDPGPAHRLKPGIELDADTLCSGLEATWGMIEEALSNWTVTDLSRTFQHPYQGKTYVVPYQWVLWRIMAHDLHHGGELAFALGMQGIAIPDLGDQGGHIVTPKVVGEE
ncbi:MAG: DinB family protein [Nitrolancea sp.]